MRSTTEPWAISKLHRERSLVDLSPQYQREAGVWSIARKQLFIDSIFNGFDIPKIYFHKLDREITGKDYAVVDGKQRLSAIYEFMLGTYSLGPDFQYTGSPIEDPPTASAYFNDLSQAARDVFKEINLSIAVIETSDEDEIEDLFSRLNNGEKLNAAEQRNAYPGRATALVRSLAEDAFFTRKLGFPNKRYSHLEVSCKLLYLESETKRTGDADYVADLKKKFLDKFVRDNKNISESDADRLLREVTGKLRKFSKVFDDNSPELSKQSYPQLMYLFLSRIDSHYAATDLTARLKQFLEDFRRLRLEDQTRDEELRDWELTEYGRLTMQGTNDRASMVQRLNILTKRFLKDNPDVVRKDSRRLFSPEERWAIWIRAEKRCQNCLIDLTFDEMHADHVRRFTDGGQTTFENARCLCESCNTSGIAN